MNNPFIELFRNGMDDNLRKKWEGIHQLDDEMDELRKIYEGRMAEIDEVMVNRLEALVCVLKPFIHDYEKREELKKKLDKLNEKMNQEET